MIDDTMTDADEVLRGLYQEGDEDARMVLPQNFVEWDRTCELLRRWLPNAPATILDVGGASGRYAQWLSSLGYSVLVIDLLTKHVEQARAKGINAEPGDARELPQATGSVDAVLLMGPLYHLPLAGDRQRALAEASRVCRSGGQVIAAAMSRWAKPAVRASRGELADAEIQRHLEAVLSGGNDPNGTDFDRVSYNHDPAEFETELQAANLRDIEVLGIEGPLGAAAREDTGLNDYAIRTARIAERHAPHLSIHLLGRGLVT